MHPHAALIERFYAAFHERDVEGMAACYHKDVVFSDPAFGELRGDHARDMWRMLAGRAKDLTVTATGIEADDRTGRAHWVATYAFGRSGRPVTNEIDAHFEFRDGLIARHDDSFDLWKWSRMALGAPGVLLGWTPMVQKRIRRDALRGLAEFEKARQ